MIYVFVDETYPAPELLRFSCVAVKQDYFNRNWSQIVEVSRSGRKARQGRIRDLLMTGDFRTVIGDLDMVKALLPLGIPDALEKKVAIPPRDDLWAHGFGYSVGYAIRQTCLSWAFGVVDVFHDPKSLNAEFQGVFRTSLREISSRLSTEEIRRLRPSQRQKIKIRRIEPVPKPATGEDFTKWQNGAWLAHEASRLTRPEQLDQPTSNLLFRDLTGIVVSCIEKRGRWFSVASGSESA